MFSSAVLGSAYLTAFAGVDSVMKTGGSVSAYPAKNGVSGHYGHRSKSVRRLSEILRKQNSFPRVP